MYHKFSNDYSDETTITTQHFEEQIIFLQKSGYQVVPLAQFLAFINGKKHTLPQKPIVLTFDDGYLNNLELAYPLLCKYNISATIFLSTAHIGLSNIWDKEQEKLMCLNQLKSLNPGIISFGLHSHQHQNYMTLTESAILTDLRNNINFFKEFDLSYIPVFAYPFGGRPKDKKTLITMKQAMKELGIKAAFRIGNRLNRTPFKDVYELQRLDIRGNEGIYTFQLRLNGLRKIF